jgi:hypothetical protein
MTIDDRHFMSATGMAAICSLERIQAPGRSGPVRIEPVTHFQTGSQPLASSVRAIILASDVTPLF